MSQRRRLAVIVVSYNVCDLLRQCLASVDLAAQRAADTLAIETVVVDNASPDASAAMVAAEFPHVHLIASEQNLGFTGGNNVALRWLGLPVCMAFDVAGPSPVAPVDYVLLLNPDAEVTGDALEQMVAVLTNNADVAVCGAGLVYGDGSFQHGAFHFPALAQAAIDLFPPTGLRGAHRLLDSRLNGRYPRGMWQQPEPFAVDFVLGAAMMVRAAAIDAVGGLDEGYWMYCEEMDWCRRFWRNGWRVLVAPAARIIHHEAQSSRKAPWRTQERLWRSRFRFYAHYAAEYPAGTLAVLRLLVRTAMRRSARRLQTAFARGEIDGVELDQGLSACRAIMRL
ncbi:MAG: glycosyltransferase family 2 protein [Caldilinea sp.]|nr:glycosyltransferase family 2 protein [Caldilinea sp.]